MTNKPQAPLPCPFCGKSLIEEAETAVAYGCWKHPRDKCLLRETVIVADEDCAAAIAHWNTRAAHSLMAAKVAELERENARLRERLNGARAASKRLGRDLLREEADAVLSAFRTEWEPLRDVAARAGAQSAAWLASRARDLQSRGLVESEWIGKDRANFKVWRSLGRHASGPSPALAPHPERHE